MRSSANLNLYLAWRSLEVNVGVGVAGDCLLRLFSLYEHICQVYKPCMCTVDHVVLAKASILIYANSEVTSDARLNCACEGMYIYIYAGPV